MSAVRRFGSSNAFVRAFVLVLVVVAQWVEPLHAQACEIDEFSPTGNTVIVAPDALDTPGALPGDCCQCDTCTDGCTHATFSLAGFAGIEAPVLAGPTPPLMFQAGFTPTDYPVDLRPPIQG